MTSWMKNQIENLRNFVPAPNASLAERLQSVCKTASLFYNRVMDNIEHGRGRLKDILEKEAKEEVENIDLATTENERALKGAYGRFVILGVVPKVDFDGYLGQAKPQPRC